MKRGRQPQSSLRKGIKKQTRDMLHRGAHGMSLEARRPAFVGNPSLPLARRNGSD